MAEDLLCPGARCEPGATLLGTINADGTVGYLTPEVRIDEEFVEVVREGRAPEKRFRFAGPCVREGCAQWTGSRCGVIDGVLDSRVARSRAEAAGPLPHCAIRPRCRWYAQSGPDAFRTCALVVTERDAEAG